MRDLLPEPLFDAVQRHLRERAIAARAGWDSASEDEDALTGDFCGALRSSWTELRTDTGAWRWRVWYKKFRGRGPEAFEKDTGADGIVQVEVHGPNGEITTKGVLFQAKKDRGSSRSDLIGQVRKMEALAPRGSAVFEFGPDAYRASAGSIVLGEFEARPGRIPHPKDDIGEYLAGQFLPCHSGLRGMYYDAVRKILVVPSNGAVKVVPLQLRHRVRFDLVHESRFEGAEGRFER